MKHTDRPEHPADPAPGEPTETPGKRTGGRHRKAALSGAPVLYAGAALTLLLALTLARTFSAWAAALLIAAALTVAARLLHRSARPHPPTTAPGPEAGLRALHREDALRGPMPTGGPGTQTPTVTTPQPESTPDPRQRPI
ncbi:hypothetical protein ABZX85_22065 [Streptomyces sp. NPDC004539]|uniref:hypothetical protein n=1 Tax=Streptomyces sp. NPDC004539 TaxID=3154280 RepID=UPI0033AD155A